MALDSQGALARFLLEAKLEHGALMTGKPISASKNLQKSDVLFRSAPSEDSDLLVKLLGVGGDPPGR